MADKDNKQYQKFKETALKLEADEAEETFERNLKQIIRPKKKPEPDKADD